MARTNPRPRKVVPLLENPEERLFAGSESDESPSSQASGSDETTAPSDVSEDLQESEADKADRLRASVPAAMKTEVIDAVHTYKRKLVNILEKHKSELTPDHDEKFILHTAGFYQIANRSTARGAGSTAFSVFMERARKSELADFDFEGDKSFEEYGKKAAELYRSLSPEEKELYEKLAQERKKTDPGSWEDQRKAYFHHTTRQWNQQMTKAETMGYEVIIMITDNYRTHQRKALGTIGGIDYYNNKLAPVNWGVEGFDDHICARNQEIALLYFLRAEELKLLPKVYELIDKEIELQKKEPVLPEEERDRQIVSLKRKGGFEHAGDDFRKEVSVARLDFLKKAGIYRRTQTQKKVGLTRVPSADAFRATLLEMGKGLVVPRNMDARQIFWHRASNSGEAKFLVDLLAGSAVKVIDAPTQTTQTPARGRRSATSQLGANQPAPRTVFYYSGEPVSLPKGMQVPPGSAVLL